MSFLRTSQRGRFKATFLVPGDKSISHRAVLLGAMANGATEIKGFLPSVDCLRSLSCVKQLGVQVFEKDSDNIMIQSPGIKGLRKPDAPLDVGNSGTTIRLMTGILSALPFSSTLIGDSSIAKRPMDRVVNPLRKMGAHILGVEGGRYAPLNIFGRELTGISHHLPIASAQVKSCLLLAGLQAKGRTQIVEPSLSRDHTERMLRSFGVKVEQTKEALSIQGGQPLVPSRVRIPGDISSAAFLLAIALMIPSSCITVENVGINPTRTGILDAFEKMGAKIEIEQTDLWGGEPVGRVMITAGELKGISVNHNWIPRIIDELPLLAVVATQAEGETVISDATELKVKESNRIATIVQELRKLGANIQEKEDGMIITGRTPLHGGIGNHHGDHRIAMALAVAGFAAMEDVLVKSDVTNISFPGFHQLMNHIMHSY